MVRGRLLCCVAVAALALGACDDDGGSTPPADAGGVGGEGGAGGGAGGTPGMGGMPGVGGEQPDAAVRLPACSDGVDNDGDGSVDLDDQGCDGPDDTDERNAAACDDAEDNDGDGLIDFPADPGCGSNVDDSEENPPVPPECNDGIDNDRDGLYDEQDDGCTSSVDETEGQAEGDVPECNNGLDDDEDGDVDFPDDVGCSAAGDPTERNPPTLPACANGLDDDANGRIDYPEDPGCAGRGDRDESAKPVTPECADSVDNDLDGRIDYPEDDGCTAASDYDERGPCGNEYDPPRLQDGVPLRLDTAGGVFESQGSCGGQGSPELAALYRLTNVIEALEITTVDPATDVVTTLYVRREACLVPDAEVACQTQREAAAPGHTLRVESPVPGDYYIFVDGVAGAGGVVMLTVNEIPLAACLNTLDDDEDGRADYPSDPGCFAPFDRDETTEALTACSNDEDDDEDGQIDFPLDPGCPSAAFDSEENSCGEVRFREFFGETPEVVADLADGSNGLSGSCGGRNHNEVIFRYELPFNARMEISTRFPETTTPVALYLRRDCADSGTQLGCDDGAAGGANGGRLVLNQATPGPYYIVVDGRDADAGQFKLAVNVERLPAGCSNDRDDDNDGLRDHLDPGCSGPEDEDETDLPDGQTPACSNGADDDGDGLTDWPFDPGCWGPGGLDEADPAEPPVCANGVDDDGDGRVDFPWDAGCVARGHFSEVDPARAPTCADGQDNDADGRIDFPFDPGCFARSDTNEFDGPMDRGACANGVDDDGDGLIDFPFDPGCAFAALDDETDPAALPACSNGADDDGDGVIDFPREPGCAFAADDDETDPVPLPVCGNGVDDDEDARVDFPDDPGCAYAAARSEGDEDFVIPRCRDGVDNDDDGLIDVADPGCVTADDDDETDPAEAPECGNDADDDGDGLTDFPADPGCVARGDVRESQDCREGVDVTPIPANGTVNGATAMGDADQYATRCGGQGAPDAVYRYVVEEAGTLVVSADNAGTDFPAVVSVLRNCEERETVVGCAGHLGRPTPTVRVEDAQPGEYYIFVDGGGPERWASAGEPVSFEDPEGYVATPDITDDCWEDGGAGAFDCYGDLIRITHGDDEALVSPAPGTRMGSAGDYGFTVDSSFVNTNIWRLHFTPAEPGDDRAVSFRLEGNMGSDGRAATENRTVMFGGREVPYLNTSDGFDGDFGDPPVVHFVMPSDPEQLDQVTYAARRDEITLTATDVTLPLTIYVAASYADHTDVIAAILSDVEIQGTGPDAAIFGNFELSVSEE